MQPLSKTLDNFESAFKAISRKGTKEPTFVNGELVLGFESFELLSKILTPERLRLLRVIRDEKPDSVSALARLVKRAQANVHKDIQFLAQLGIITLKEQRKAGQKGKIATQPRFDFEGFEIAV